MQRGCVGPGRLALASVLLLAAMQFALAAPEGSVDSPVTELPQRDDVTVASRELAH